MLRSIIKSYSKRMANLFHPGSVVLMYHRINEDGLDPWKLSVTPEHFEEHLKILKRYADPVPLNEIIEHPETSRKKKKVAVTFDDGYADNLYNAKPLLELYSVPAVFFISTGHINSSREFWWDELEYNLLQPGILPDRLSLQLNGNIFNYELGKAASYTSSEYLYNFGKPPWLSNPGTRLNFYYQLWQKLLPLKNNERNILLDQITQWSGISLKTRESHRTLNYQELLQLGSSDLIEIGAHGANHPVLPEHTADYQLNDIRESKRFLERSFNRIVKSFAYPHGEYSDETALFVQSSGFASACTTDHGPVPGGFHPYKIPRIQIEDWNGNSFHKLLNKWFFQ